MKTVVTAVITIIISVISGMIVEYFKNFAPKIRYKIGNGIPIHIEDSKKCAYIITACNSSNKTIKDITMIIESPVSKLTSAGVVISKALKYDIEEKEDMIEVSIPFMSKGDEFSVTVYTEDHNMSSLKPNVIIRSPEGVKNINQDDSAKRSLGLAAKIAPAVLAGVLVAITLDIITPDTDQKDKLMLLSSSFGLHELTIMYSNQEEINYYDQGALIYAKASECEDIEKIKRYRDYLIAVREGNGIAKLSKSVINYHIGKISLLLGDEKEAKLYFGESVKLGEKHIRSILRHDEAIGDFFVKESILKPD